MAEPIANPGTGAAKEAYLEALWSIRDKAASKKSAEAAPSATNSAVLLTTSRNTFSLELENHIHDYYNGRPYLSRKVAGEIEAKNFENASSMDPRVMKSYLGYASALPYGQRARFISGVESTQKMIDQMV